VSGPGFHLALGLDGVGWHPGAAALLPQDAARTARASYWSPLVRRAEAAGIDLVTWEDSFRPSRGAYGVPDGVLLASALAPVTEHIGLVPTVVVTSTEPFHVAKAVATLDHVSLGRAGVRIKVDAQHRGPRFDGSRDVFADATDVVEVLGRLWDSWEDDAEIRDVATGRFVDRDRLHHVDFVGEGFSVKGPLITPRPPQGRPPVVVLAHDERAFALAATSADVVLVTPGGPFPGDDVPGALARVRAAAVAAGRTGAPLRVLGEVAFVLGRTTADAHDRAARLEEAAGRPWRSDAHLHVGTAPELADLVTSWADAGLDGVRFRPATHTGDVRRLLDETLPLLAARGSTAHAPDRTTLRDRLGLERPVSRYAEEAR